MMNFNGYYHDRRDEFNSLVYENYDLLLKDFRKEGHGFVLSKYYNFILDKHKELTKKQIENEFNVFKNLMSIEGSYVLDVMMIQAANNTKFYKIYKSIFGEIKEPDIELLNDDGEIDISEFPRE